MMTITVTPEARNEAVRRGLEDHARMILQFEPDTLIDPVTKRAREIYSLELGNSDNHRTKILFGGYDDLGIMKAIIRALKEGMPK